MSSTVLDFFRLPRTALPKPSGRMLRVAAGGAAALGGAVALALFTRPAELPGGVAGTVVFVSDRSGIDSLYIRRLPDGREERLVAMSEPAGEPALSPDGRRVAFSVGGRIGVVGVDGRGLRLLTSGTDWKDETPVWRPDGKSLVVASRNADSENRDLYELRLDSDADAARRPLVQTPMLDESQPAVSPDGTQVVFVRGDDLYRLDGADSRVHRISGGLRKVRAPRFLASGRVLFLWSEGKDYGIDVTDIDGREHETLQHGTAFYRTVAPSPDARFLAATFTYDLGFHSWQAFELKHQEQLRLLDVHGTPLADLAGSWRYANHTADWGR
jgi:Tol biopolymer transport system component